MECSDVTHNCFAGITGCSSSEPLPSVSTEVISVQSAEPTLQDVVAAPSRSPAVSDQAFFVQSSQPTGTSLSTEVILVQSAEPTLQDVVAAPSRSPSVSEQAFVVQSSQPTGTSLSTEVILVQSDGPTSQNVVPAPSRSPAVSEQALVVQSAEPTSESDGGGGYQNPSGNTFFCGETYDKIDEQCFTSKPCPSGRGSDYCANHEGCFSVPSCTAQYESAVDAISPPPPTMSPNSSMQPSTKPVNAPPSRVRCCLNYLSTRVLDAFHMCTNLLILFSCYIGDIEPIQAVCVQFTNNGIAIQSANSQHTLLRNNLG